MSLPNPYAQYRQNAVETATPTRLVVMLYDGAIRFLGQALPAMQERRYDAQSCYISKAQAILSHLRATLNPDAGAVSGHLSAMYVRLYDGLTEANLRDDREKVERTIWALRELREAWIEVDRQCQASKGRVLSHSETKPELAAA